LKSLRGWGGRQVKGDCFPRIKYGVAMTGCGVGKPITGWKPVLPKPVLPKPVPPMGKPRLSFDTPKNRFRLSVFLVVAVIIFSIPAFAGMTGETQALIKLGEAGGCRVEDLSNETYYPAVITLLGEAKEEIDILMYMIVLPDLERESPVKMLLDALINAHRRGVKVRVILEYRTSKDFDETGENYLAYKYLKRGGINVKFDNASICTHNKVIVIDSKIVIVGSTNWSERALRRSNETNVLIESPQLALKILKRIESVKLLDIEESTELDKRVLIPRGFLLKGGYLKTMVGKHDGRIFDLYLLFLKDFQERPYGKVSIGYKEIIEMFGLSDKVEPRLIVNELLRSMERKYGLIALRTEREKPFEVELVDYDNPKKPLGIKKEDSIYLPYTYWECSWDRTLTLKEKVCLLINLAETRQEEGLLEWSLYRSQILRKYNINRHIFTDGMQGLRRYGIIEMKYAPLSEEDKRSGATVYKLLGLFNIEGFKEGLNEIKVSYGEKKTEKARSFASIVYKGWDLEVIEDILRKMDIYGEKVVGEVFSIVEKWNPASPKRCYGYVVGMLRKRK